VQQASEEEGVLTLVELLGETEVARLVLVGLYLLSLGIWGSLLGCG